MKETFFYFSLKRAATLCLALGAVCTTALTLNSCGGGGKEDDGTEFKVTPTQFRAGSRGFSIQSNSGWEFWSDSSETAATDFILSDSDVAAGTIVTYGYMYYSFTGIRSQLYGLMRYTYDPVTNKGTLRYSIDATNLGNIDGVDTAGKVTMMINNIHGSPWEPGGEGGGAKQDGDGEEGESDVQDDISTHLAHTTIVFDFNTGTCVWTCGCEHQSNTMDFLIRRR